MVTAVISTSLEHKTHSQEHSHGAKMQGPGLLEREEESSEGPTPCLPTPGGPIMRWPKPGLVRTNNLVAKYTKCTLWVGRMIQTCSHLRVFALAVPFA